MQRDAVLTDRQRMATGQGSMDMPGCLPIPRFPFFFPLLKHTAASTHVQMDPAGE